MRKLTYKALLLMNGYTVVVHDLEYDCYDQICEVQVEEKPLIEKCRKTTKVRVPPSYIKLVNEEFTFIYNNRGNCENGEFEVYNYDE